MLACGSIPLAIDSCGNRATSLHCACRCRAEAGKTIRFNLWDGICGIKVKIRQADQKKARWELYSDHAGEFAQRVPAGRADYVVWADLKGCKAPECKRLRQGTEVTVHIENDERTDISLHLK
jgi:hypothetical protein